MENYNPFAIPDIKIVTVNIYKLPMYENIWSTTKIFFFRFVFSHFLQINVYTIMYLQKAIMNNELIKKNTTHEITVRLRYVQ